jgi:hypothetical protein
MSALIRPEAAPSGKRFAAISPSALLAVLAAFAAAVYVSLSVATTADYNIANPVSADNAAPAIEALAHGRITAFFAHQPLMGALSLVLRAPVAWLVGTLGGGQMSIYRFGALVCMLPAAALGAWLMLDARRAGAALAGIAAAGVVVIGSPTVAALGWGHPEEVLTAVLCVAAVLAAERDHPVWAAVAAGAAFGTKDWAAIVALPVLLLLRRRCVRAVLAGGITGLVFGGLPALIDPAAFHRASQALGSTRLATALSVWWPVSSRSPSISRGAPLASTLPLHLTKSSVLPIGLGLGMLLAAALAWGGGRSGGWLCARGRAVDPLALLALLALVRCIADPAPVEYYYVAATIPLAAWEATTLRRLPLAAIVSVLAVRFSFGHAMSMGAGTTSVLTLSWTLSMIVYLGTHAFFVGRSRPTSSLALGGR